MVVILDQVISGGKLDVILVLLFVEWLRNGVRDAVRRGMCAVGKRVRTETKPARTSKGY